MKTRFLLLYAAAFCAAPAAALQAQPGTPVLDTLRMNRLQGWPPGYTVEGLAVPQVMMEDAGIARLDSASFKFGSNIVQGGLSLLTGIGFGKSKDAQFRVSGKISTGDTLADWYIDVYCEGSVTKVSSREGEKGSYTVNTYYENTIHWNNGAAGFILEGNDTLGSFSVVFDPCSRPELARWTSKVFPQPGTAGSGQADNASFAIAGWFLERESVILYNASENRFYRFREDELQGIYQYARYKPLVRKSRQQQPYALVSAAVPETERLDIFRMLLAGELVIDYIVKQP